MAAITEQRARYPALRHRNFVLIWSGLLVSNMGTWMQNVAQSWLIYKLTGNNPFYLGLLGLSFALPMIVVPLLGGALADRVDRIRLLYVTQTAALLLAFDNPTRQALIPELVPRDDLLNALALNSATYTGAALVGPAIAGLLLDVVGAGWLFMGNAVSYLAVIGALVAMRDAPSQPRRAVSLRDGLLDGFRYAGRHTLILVLLLLAGPLLSRVRAQPVAGGASGSSCS